MLDGEVYSDPGLLICVDRSAPQISSLFPVTVEDWVSQNSKPFWESNLIC